VGSATGSIRRPTKEDFTTEIPSIIPERPREPFTAPPPLRSASSPARPMGAAARSKPRGGGGGRGIPKVAILWGAAALLVVGAGVV
jgi:hypothetical protein